MIYFFLLEDDSTPTTYSGKLFAKGLKSAGYPVAIIQNDQKKRSLLRTLKSGTIVFQKCLHPLHQAINIKHLKGKVSLIHIDDDYLKMDKAEHLQTLKTTDLILVGSSIHQQMLAWIHTPSAVIRAITDLNQFPYARQSLRNNSPPIISWQQSFANIYAEDLLEIAEPLTMLYKKIPYRLRLFGWRKETGKSPRHDLVEKLLPFAEFITHVPLSKFFSVIIPQLQQSNIFIVPYRNTPRSWAKGGFALRQMMALGVPVVVSKIGMHNEIIKDGVNGFLATTHDEWFSKLYKILTEPGLSEEFSINGRMTIEKEYSTKKCMEIFIQAISPFLQ